MSLSKSLQHYSDIADDLFAVLQHNVRHREFAAPAAAHRWRMRVYMYRSLIGAEKGSPFDHLYFRITKDKPNVVSIHSNYEDVGYFLDADGNIVGDTSNPQLEAQMREDARELARKLGFEDPFPNETAPQTLDELGIGEKSH